MKYLAVITEDLGSETCYVSFAKRVVQDGALNSVPVVSSRSSAFTISTTPTLNATDAVINGIDHPMGTLLTFVVTAADNTSGLIGEIVVSYETPLSDGSESFHVKRSTPPEAITTVTSSYIKGEDGRSAYEVGVANGFVGTESEWLASLNSSWTVITQAAYDLLTPPDPDTLYIVVG